MPSVEVGSTAWQDCLPGTPEFSFAALAAGEVLGEPGDTVVTSAVDALEARGPRSTVDTASIVLLRHGEEVARKPNLYWRLPMNVTLTLEARPPLIRWGGPDGREPAPENCTPEGFPTEMEVDYVRCWTLKD